MALVCALLLRSSPGPVEERREQSHPVLSQHALTISLRRLRASRRFRLVLFSALCVLLGWDSSCTKKTFLLLKVLVGRFVDDLFDASRDDLKWLEGRCTDRVAKALGLIVEPGQSEDDLLVMKLLSGHERAVHTEIDEDKASLSEHTQSECMDAGQLAKAVRRMAFAVKVTHGNVGRHFFRLLCPAGRFLFGCLRH